MSTVLVIGYFNVLHAGHVRHLKALAQVGDVHVGLYNDKRNQAAYGSEAVPLMERIECLRACVHVADVVVTGDPVFVSARLEPEWFGGDEAGEYEAGDLGLRDLVCPEPEVTRVPAAAEATRPTPWLGF